MVKFKLGFVALIGLLVCLIIIYYSNIFDNWAYQRTGLESEGKLLDCDNVKGEKYRFDNVPIDFTGVNKGCFEGKLTSIDTYKDGVLNGLSKEWHINGILVREETYDNGLIMKSKKWYGNGGKIEKEEVWVKNEEGIRTGTVKEYYWENSQLQSIKEYSHKNLFYEDIKLISQKCWDENGENIDCN